MSVNNKVVRIFTLPLQFPCGPNSSCCGPIGQTEEEIKKLSDAIKNLGVEVEVYNITEKDISKKFPSVVKLLTSFGPGIVPVLAIGDEVISVGRLTPEEAVKAIKENIN